jgi:selenocysteine lyase/cysteine desulfurase
MSHEFEQPGILPDKFESGTMNIPGILGLKKAVEFINSIGVKAIHEKEMMLANAFIGKVQKFDGVRLIGNPRVSVVSLDFPGRDNAAIAEKLDSGYGVMTRCGLHCAPNAHKTLGTYPHGTVRFSFGYFNTPDETDYIAQTIGEILHGL